MAIDDLNDDGLGTIIEFDVDLNDIEKPEELPAGQYLARIVTAEPKTSNNTGSRYLRLVITIPPEQFPATFDVENAPQGFTMQFNRLSLEKGKRPMYRLKTFLESLGVPFSTQFDTAELVDKEVLIEVVHETYEGEDRAQIKSVRAA